MYVFMQIDLVVRQSMRAPYVELDLFSAEAVLLA